MKKILFILLLSLYSSVLFGQIVLAPTTSQVFEVGDLVEMRVVSGEEYVTNEMINTKFGKIDDSKMLFMSVSKIEGMTQAKLVLAGKFNPAEIIPLEGFGEQLNLTFQNLEFNPISSTKKEFKYIEMELLPEKQYLRFFKWLTVVLVCCLVAGLMFLGFKRYLKLQNLKRVRSKWISRIESANTLSACSQIWLEREQLRSDFPELIEEINLFFASLSPDQFQFSAQEELKSEIRNLKNSLLIKIKERKLGI